MTGNGWSIETAYQEADSGIVAGDEREPENTLKVETGPQIPRGLQQRNRRSAPVSKAPGFRARTTRVLSLSDRLVANLLGQFAPGPGVG